MEPDDWNQMMPAVFVYYAWVFNGDRTALFFGVIASSLLLIVARQAIWDRLGV